MTPSPKTAAPFYTFSDAELAWLATTAETDTGLALELNKAGDDRGQMLYATGANEAPMLPWCVLAVGQGVTVEKVNAVGAELSALGEPETSIGPVSFFPSLRVALADIASRYRDLRAIAA